MTKLNLYVVMVQGGKEYGIRAEDSCLAAINAQERGYPVVSVRHANMLELTTDAVMHPEFYPDLFAKAAA